MGDRDSVTMSDPAILAEQITSEPTFPLVEVFGPTIQGEGPDAGLPVYFMRFGLCDYRCDWCDSMYAVDPRQLRDAGVQRVTADAAVSVLRSLPPGAGRVVLSGGNPLVHDLGGVVLGLRAAGLDVAVETQGSIFRDWLADVDTVIVSPKPPSSLMATARHAEEHRKFLEACGDYGIRVVFKYVAFNAADLQWALDHQATYGEPDQGDVFFLSVGTEPGEDTDGILRRYRELAEDVARRGITNAKVLPQLHVLIWGHARGV
jgi:7-carboxy-7-deazaguanine synthase